MSEYDFFRKILSDKYLVSDQNKMIEKDDENKTIQKTTINSNGRGINNYSLYQFVTKERHDFLSFFEGSNQAPKNLRAFCDYVIIADILGKLNILLIELKSGDASHASKQLEASHYFMEFIKQTMMRIKDENNCSNIDIKKIIIKKIVVKPHKSFKITTNPGRQKSIDIKYNSDKEYYTYKTNIFDIAHICRGIEKYNYKSN